MFYSILYLVLAALGLGLLVFIHELGHYFAGKREGIRVEAFSIGFGRAIKAWEKNGVKWQIGIIPFGGYVRFAGMEKKGNLEPYKIPGGFYEKTPWARIRVCLAGPLVNILFAFFLFSLIWISGGREKPFSEYTGIIGRVESGSGPYQNGIRPGDEIVTYGGQPFGGFGSLLSSAFLDPENPVITGYKIDYFHQEKTPFSYTFPLNPNLKGFDRFAIIASTMGPASYLIYRPDSLMVSSPVKEGGILPGDRVVWVDGEVIFSRRQLTEVINAPGVLLTVLRGKEKFLTKVPRITVRDLKMKGDDRAELEDWAHAIGLANEYRSLRFIPYVINSSGQVESPLSYVDEDSKQRPFFSGGENPLEKPLIPGDVILAADGKMVSSGKDLLQALQTRGIRMIVQRGESYASIARKEADAAFISGISFSDLQGLIDSVTDAESEATKGNLVLLKTVYPKPLSELPLKESVRDKRESALSERKKKIEEIENPTEQALALQNFETDRRKLFLGGIFEDRNILYNPSPVTMLGAVFDESWKTMKVLFTGYLSPKYMSGPVGIVGAIQYGWSLGVKEALFWLAVISVNLGIVNLLPIPVLDGGHICFALYERISGRRISSKTMERLLFPFLILIIVFFIYLTYQDVLRVIARFFH